MPLASVCVCFQVSISVAGPAAPSGQLLVLTVCRQSILTWHHCGCQVMWSPLGYSLMHPCEDTGWQCIWKVRCSSVYCPNLTPCFRTTDTGSLGCTFTQNELHMHPQRQRACSTSIYSSGMSSQANTHPSHLQLYAGLAHHTPLLTLHSSHPPPRSLPTSVCREPLSMGQALRRAGSGDLERSCEMLSMGHKTL